MSNLFLDINDIYDPFSITIPITYRDRLNAVCWDEQRCTIANAIVSSGASVGITSLGRRGVSRTYVDFTLDPAIWPNADPSQTYRGKLTQPSAELAADLDDFLGRDKAHARFKRVLRKMVAPLPLGEDTVWDTITITQIPPSRLKGAFRGTSSGISGSRTGVAVPGAPARRYGATTVSPFNRPVKQP